MTQPQTEMVEKDYADAMREALSLATALHRRWYAHVPQWRPLDTVAGIISQIDNMTAGLGERLDDAEIELARRTIAPDIEELVGALRAAKGYALNAKIDLQTGAPKTTAIRTIDGGIAKIDAALSKFTNTKGNDRG